MEMKINALIALVAMATMGTMDFGIVKAGCWLVLIINFIAFMLYFEREQNGVYKR